MHGLEATRAIGWDLGHWGGQQGPFSDLVTANTLTDLAGNAWSLFAFVPIAIAAVGAAKWSAYKQQTFSDDVDVLSDNEPQNSCDTNSSTL